MYSGRETAGSGRPRLQAPPGSELVAALDEFLQRLEGTRVDQVTDVARQFADEEFPSPQFMDFILHRPPPPSGGPKG